MPKPQLIGPLQASTPSGLKHPSPSGGDLPDDLLRAASLRLGIMSLLAAACWILGHALGRLAQGAMFPDSNWTQLDATDAIGGGSILVSLALFAYTRRAKSDPRFILDLGLVYMVYTASALAVMFHWFPPPPGSTMFPEISWVGAVLLMFAAIVPSRPRKTLIAGLIAASMNPIAMLVARERGVWSFDPPSQALLMHYPDYLLVGVAVVISHVMTKLGQQVRKAREMGSYQLGEVIGRGGMGEVYRATHRMLARPAAIKLIRPEMLGAVDGQVAQLTVARFRREAEVAAKLRSQHTVELYDFGVTEDGTLYLVMECLDGMDLESLVREKGPLPAGRVTYILRQVCDSLEEAHIMGLVHRDIKPANIHLGMVGRHHDFVKVMDFGLVKAVADVSSEDTLATTPGQMALGTPAYMSPEMALGETVDGRADIYALGCVAYFLLTGELVFVADKTVQMIASHLQMQPIPPSQRVERPIPPALERLVLKCLAKNAEDRPQSAALLADALDFIPVDPWGEDQAKEWWATQSSPAPKPVPAASIHRTGCETAPDFDPRGRPL